MQTTGELIRLLGYVDDIAATLHRIDATIPTLTPEELSTCASPTRTSSSYSRHWKREAISGRSVPRSATDAQRLALLTYDTREATKRRFGRRPHIRIRLLLPQAGICPNQPAL